MPLSFRRFFCLAAAMAAVQLLGLAAPVSACDTPVYRYAMYRWEPTPYELYYFHRDEPGEADQKVKQLVDAMGRRDAESRANLVYLPVNLDEDEKLVGVPADVKQGWLAKEDPPVPSYMLVTPLGQQVYFGEMSVEEIEKLVVSPARTRFAKLLGEGNTGVMMLIDGKDEKANEAALEMLQAIADEVETGKIDLYGGAADMFPPGVGPPGLRGPQANPGEAAKEGEEDGAKKEKPKTSVGLIRLSRDDPREKWLLKQLQAAEPDLDKYADQPMVFVAYGRGRALPPYIGAGITRENLLDCLYFISGACSCTVKEQNPGVDLLVRYNWDAAAQTMAEKFPGEEGADRFGVDNLFPELIFSPPKPKSTDEEPVSTDVATTTDDNTAGSDEAATDETPATSTTNQDTSDDDTTTTEKPVTAPETPDESSNNSANSAEPKDNPQAVKPAKNEQHPPAENASANAEKSVALATSPDSGKAGGQRPGESAEKAGSSIWYTVGIGLGVVLLVLVGATMLFYRPK